MNAAYQVPAHLRLVCRKCTREIGYEGTLEQAEAMAKRAGWIVEWYCPTCKAPSRQPVEDELLVCACGGHGAMTRVTCPKCPGIREPRHREGIFEVDGHPASAGSGVAIVARHRQRLSDAERAMIGAAAIRGGHANPGDVLTLPSLPDEPPITAEVGE